MTYTVNGKAFDERAEAGPVPAHVRPLAGLARRQKGLRRRRLRCLHGVARRRSGTQLHHPRVPRRGPRSHHHRGARHTGEPASDATAVPGRSGVPVWILHRGDDHDVGDLHRRPEAGPAARAEGKPLPLHRISRHRGRGQRRVSGVEDAAPGQTVGASVVAPAATGVVTGTVEFTMDTEMAGMLHLKVLHSPHAHARIVSIDKSAALEVPGVHRVYTWEDVPRKRYSTAIHTDHLVDPDDTYMLDNVMRFVGQRVVAVVADSVGAAEEGCRKVAVEYEVLPAVFDPEEAMADGAPQLHSYDDPFALRQGAQHPARTARRGRRRRSRFRRSRRDPRGHLLLAPRPARPPRDTRFDRVDGGRPVARADQFAVAVCRETQTLPSVQPSARSASGVLQEGRRWVRRQAGGHLRRPGGAGGAGHRSARLLGVHPGRGVHHGLTAPPDEGHGEARRARPTAR